MISGVTRRACSWPRAAKLEADPAASLRASWVARVNTLLALAIVALGLSPRR